MAATAVDDVWGALAYTAFSLAMVTVRFAGGRLISMAGPARVLRLSGLMAIGGGLLTMLAPHYAAKLIGFAGLALITPIFYGRAANDDLLSPGAGLASVATMGYGGMLLGPVIIGALAATIAVVQGFAVMVCLGVGILLFSHAIDRWCAYQPVNQLEGFAAKRTR